MRKKNRALANTRSRRPRSHHVPTAARWRARHPKAANGTAMSSVRAKPRQRCSGDQGVTLLPLPVPSLRGRGSRQKCAKPICPVRRPGLADKAITERTSLDLPVRRWGYSPLSQTHPRCRHRACRALAEPLGVSAGPGPGAPLTPQCSERGIWKKARHSKRTGG